MKRVLALLLVACSAGCPQAEYGLLVNVKTDFVPGIEFNAVRASLHREAPADGAAPIAEAREPAFLDDDFAAGRRIADLPLGSGHFFVLAELIGAGGLPVAEGLASFDGGATVTLTVVIPRACSGVRCPVGQTCRAGACCDPDDLEGGPEACPTGCTSATECAAAPPCVDVLCESGECLRTPRIERCADGEYCSPDDGCVPFPEGFDAGPPDAGAIDAGMGIDSGPTPTPDCSGLGCGPARNGIGGPDACGTCPGGHRCDSGVCNCVPDCSGRTCGSDPVCGTSCGSCGPDTYCDGANCVCSGTGGSCSGGPVCCAGIPCTGGTCCVGNGGGCGGTGDCCPGPNVVCNLGECCVQVTGSCGSGAECCPGRSCVGGRCCVGLFEGCSSDEQCCNFGMANVGCRAAGCCWTAGHGCVAASEGNCCDGTCIGGVC